MKILENHIGTKIFLIVLIIAGFDACKKIDLIEPMGLEVNVQADSIVFGVIGDYGLAGEPEQKVADMVKSWNPDFIITTGDNNYDNGKFKTIKENITQYYGDYIYNFDALEEFKCKGKAFDEEINRFFPSPGNHDGHNRNDLKPYLNYFTLPYVEEYYKFTWGPVTFYSLNSLEDDMDEQREWLYEQLDTSESVFNVVYFHHSPYATGSHESAERMQLDYYTHGVDAVLTGHDHIYSRIEKKDEPGMYYIINGLGGKSIYDLKLGSLDSDMFDAFGYNQNYGAMKVSANSEKLIMEFYAIDKPNEPIDKVIIDKTP